jgi:hypothetical protein
MEPLREAGRALLIIGIVLAVVGGLLFFGARLPFRLGRLPGDILYRGRHGSCYFTIVKCGMLCLWLTLIFWIIGQFRR